MGEAVFIRSSMTVQKSQMPTTITFTVTIGAKKKLIAMRMVNELPTRSFWALDNPRLSRKAWM